MVSKTKQTDDFNSFFNGFAGVAITYQSDFSPVSIIGPIEALTGYRALEITTGKPAWQSVIHPEDQEGLKTDFQANVNKNPNFSGLRAYRVVHKDGQVKWLNEQIQCVTDDQGKLDLIRGLICEHSPVSEKSRGNQEEAGPLARNENEWLKEEIQKRKRAEAEFLKEKEFLKKILDSFTHPFYVIDTDTYRVSLANQAAISLFGKERTTCYELSHQRTEPCNKTCVCPLQVVKETGQPCFTEHIHVDQNTNVRYFAVHGFPVFDDTGTVSQIIEYSFEITKQRKAELALQESEEKYRLLFDNERDAIYLFDADSYEIIDANRTAQELYQFDKSELLSKKAPGLTAQPEETVAMIQSAKVGKSSKVHLSWHTKKDGTVFPVESSAIFFDWKGRTLVCATVRDVTERREREEQQSRLEKRLSITQRMNAIGTLAGGIAHDFNNLLFAQIGYLEMALSKLPDTHVCHNYVNESLKAGLRAAELVKQILTFSRSDQVINEPVNIAPILKETVKMLASGINAAIKIETDIDVNCHNVIGNPVQIHQLILNISANAEYAMKETGGELCFELKEKQLSQKTARDFGFDTAGTYISLVVSDTGLGMPPDIKEHIFEPYYTTKPYWQGGGMGLAVVHGIVENNMEGVISVESEPGKGSRFTMLFPALMEGQDIHKSVFVEEKKKILKNQVVVLFIDDDEMVCSMSKTILGNLGYHVIAHTDPKDAIITFKKEFQFIDLVITNHIMPGMTGIQLAKDILNIKRDIDLILMTSEELATTREEHEKKGISRVISKPVSKHTLIQTISEVLKTRSAP